MANTLLEAIQKNSQQVQQPGLQDETARIQSLQRAKSGKSVGGPSVAASNLGERVAVLQAQQQIQNEVLPQAQIQQFGLQQQQQEVQQGLEQQKQQIAQARRFDDIQTQIRTDSILNDLAQNRGRMDAKREQAMTEQAVSNMRLQSKQYVDDLNREAARSRLDIANNFEQELVRSSLGNKQEILEKALGNRSVLSANENQFRRAMADMGIDDAYAILNSELAGQQQAGKWQAAGGLAKAGVAAYGSYADKQDADKLAAEKKAYYTSGAGASNTSFDAYQARQQKGE